MMRIPIERNGITEYGYMKFVAGTGFTVTMLAKATAINTEQAETETVKDAEGKDTVRPTGAKRVTQVGTTVDKPAVVGSGATIDAAVADLTSKAIAAGRL